MGFARGIKETLKNLRHGTPQPKFCPKCKGINIYPASSLGGWVPTTYKCKDCDYEGYIVLELEPGELERLREENKERDSNESNNE